MLKSSYDRVRSRVYFPLYTAAALLMACSLFTLRPAHAALIDAIVATVDTEVILYSELLRDADADLQELRRSAMSQEAYARQVDKTLQATLDQAIESKILYREALLLGLEVTDEDIESRLDSLRALYPTNEAFLQDLDAAGETLRDFRERTRKRIMAQQMSVAKTRQLEREAVVSEAEVQRYYDEHRSDYERPERIRVRQIFLRAKSNPVERARARARLELIQEELVAGADFAELAALYSEAPGAEQGGIIGWQQRGDLVESLEEVAFSLGEGEVGEIAESRGGLHLMKVDRREQAGIASVDEMRPEIEPILRYQSADKRYRKWVQELRKRRRVRVLL